MATFGSLPTLLDVAKAMDPNGAPAKIIELLAQQNPIILDAVWQEGNLPTGHQSTVRTGLPTSYWRMANQGVPSSKSTTAQVDDVCGSLEQRGQVDVRVARLNGMTSAYRLSENIAHMESMNQEMARALFYGNIQTNPEQFMGLSPRYSSLSAENGENIIDGLGSSTDNTSIWLICWGENTVKMIYPKGQQAGLQHQDLGEGDAFDADANRYRALMDLYTWQVGMAVPDWRYAVRIANIDISNLVANTSALDLLDAMISAYHKLPAASMGKCAWYCNRTIGTMLHKQARDQANVYLTAGEEEGKPKVSCLGYPIRVTDALLENETRVT
jgi:hypothetical protein